MKKTNTFTILKKHKKWIEIFSKTLETGNVITLRGNVGSGKTTFTRNMIQSVFKKKIVVPSPTFTLLQTYITNDNTIYHFDFYRLENNNIQELGIKELFNQGILFIEWPDKLKNILPKSKKLLKFMINSNTKY